MTPDNHAGTANAETRLRSFIDKFAPKDRKLIRAVRAAMRKRFPTANELVWDNYNFFVIGYSPTERPADSVVSISRTSQRSRGVLHSRGGSSRSQEAAARLGKADPLHSRRNPRRALA